MGDPGHPEPAQTTYTLLNEVRGSYFARKDGGRLTLLVPVTETRAPLDRATGDVVLSFRPSVQFDVPGKAFKSNAAIIECANEALGETFHVLAEDVARRVVADSARPAPQDVSQALARWEELLRAKRSLSREEELGLWGELWFLLELPDIARGVAVWRGPDAEFVDFVGGGVGVECKASSRRLEHFVSQEQVTRPLGDLAAYLLSIWLDRDAISGRTVNDLVDGVGKRLESRSEFEEKLLSTGYSRADAHRYKLKLRLLEHPLLFPVDTVPRVRSADPGVSHIRFLASLTEDAALPPAAAIETMAKLCS